jgi:putative transposase
MSAVQVGGIEDHIHALVMARPSWAPSNIAQLLKSESSKWIHEEFEDLRSFRWQDGYAGLYGEQVDRTEGGGLHFEPT